MPASAAGLAAPARSCANDSGPALSADSLQVDQSLFLVGGFTATGSCKGAAVNLNAAHIGGMLLCSGAELRNDSGPALSAYNLQVDQSLFLVGGFTATGSGAGGAVNLNAAHIGGMLLCSGAELRNDSGPALSADSLQVDQALFLADKFTGRGERGAVRLTNVHIGGRLDCSGAELRNDSGPALSADRLQVDQSLFLRRGFTATGSGERGAVSVTNAHIGGRS